MFLLKKAGKNNFGPKGGLQQNVVCLTCVLQNVKVIVLLAFLPEFG